MPKSPPKKKPEQPAKPAAPAERPEGYLAWSRHPAVGIVAVLPLWIGYETLRLRLTPEERNGVEAMVMDTLSTFGPGAMTVLRAMMAAIIFVSAWVVLRRHIPWARVMLVSILEGTFYGLLLGPITGALTKLAWTSVWLSVGDVVPDLVSSLGAGIFEEAMFRLGLLSVFALIFGRLAHAIGISSRAGIVVAVLLSSVLFAWFHHVGPGHDPWNFQVFLYRSVAGLLLGTMYVFRGFAVCVYAHAIYDVHYYLAHG